MEPSRSAADVPEPAVLATATVTRRIAHAKSLTHGDIQQLVKNAPGDIVADLIPEGSVNIVVGDSGIGKTALLIQLGLCVAGDKPFLGQKVRQGNVLYVDYENGLSGLVRLQERLAEHLGLEAIPDSFRILHQPSTRQEVDQEIAKFRPVLVIVDALRGFDANAEENNSKAAAMIASAQKVSKQHGTAWLLVHHIRKQSQDYAPTPLMVARSIMDWLLQAAGARALINQTAVRIGIDAPKTGSADLVMRGHHKLKGEFGPWSIARNYDEAGEPIGYKRMTGADLLDQEQRNKFAALPDEFTFTEAERIYGKKGGKPTSEWLKRCQGAGIVAKSGQGKRTRYCKVASSDIAGSET